MLSKGQYVTVSGAHGTCTGVVIVAQTPAQAAKAYRTPIRRLLLELGIEQVAFIELLSGGPHIIALYNSTRGWLDLDRQHLTITTTVQQTKGAAS